MKETRYLMMGRAKSEFSNTKKTFFLSALRQSKSLCESQQMVSFVSSFWIEFFFFVFPRKKMEYWKTMPHFVHKWPNAIAEWHACIHQTKKNGRKNIFQRTRCLSHSEEKKIGTVSCEYRIEIDMPSIICNHIEKKKSEFRTKTRFH